MPEWFTPEQAQVWDRYAAQLRGMGLLHVTDADALTCLVLAVVQRDGQPLAHIHRQQQWLITLREKEILRHTPGSQAPGPAQRRRAVCATG